MLPCLFPSSRITSTTTNNTAATNSSSAPPANYEKSLHQPIRRGLFSLSSRSCRGHRQHCVPLPRARALVRNSRELLWMFGAWSGKEVGTCHSWSDPKPSVLYVCADTDTDAAVLLLPSSAEQAMVGSTVTGCWVSLSSGSWCWPCRT